MSEDYCLVFDGDLPDEIRSTLDLTNYAFNA